MRTSQTTPWYKQFWPWFLISIPLASIILSSTMIHLAITTEHSLVVDEYYKEGKGINRQITKFQEAKVRGIKTRLQFSDDSVTLTFVDGMPETGEALKLDFHHVTLESKDFVVLLTQDAEGNYRANLEHDTTGKWRITLHPLNDQWRVMHTIALPRTQAFDFNS